MSDDQINAIKNTLANIVKKHFSISSNCGFIMNCSVNQEKLLM